MRFDVLGGKRPFTRYQLEPPGVPPGGPDLWPPYQIAFAHDADKLALLADNGRPTDMTVQQDGGDFTNARINVHRNDVGDHHVCSFHDGVLLSVKLLYYSFLIFAWRMKLDYQFVANPTYN